MRGPAAAGQEVNSVRKQIVLPVAVVFSLLFVGAQAFADPAKGHDKKSPSGKRVYATLTWDAPTTNTDGSPLTDLAGYAIYYRLPSQKEYDEHRRIGLDDDDLSCKQIRKKKREPGRTECTYPVRRLTGGPYMFVVRAFNKAGKESGPSNEVKK
jgi:hypothetical protein